MNKRFVFRCILQGLVLYGLLCTTSRAAEGPPQILDLTYRPVPFHADTGIEVLPKLMDDKEGGVTFSCRWFVNGEEVEDLQDSLLPGEYFRRGDRISVEVTPGLDAQQGRPVRSGEIEAGNAPPRFVSRPPESVATFGYGYQLEAVDVDQDVLSYRLLEAPPGMRLDVESGLLTWVFDQWQQGPIDVTVAVEDGFGGQTKQEFTMNPSFAGSEGPRHE